MMSINQFMDDFMQEMTQPFFQQNNLFSQMSNNRRARNPNQLGNNSNQTNARATRNQSSRQLHQQSQQRPSFFEQNFGQNVDRSQQVECTFCNKKMHENQLTQHWNNGCSMGRQRRNQNQRNDYTDELEDNLQERYRLFNQSRQNRDSFANNNDNSNQQRVNQSRNMSTNNSNQQQQNNNNSNARRIPNNNNSTNRVQVLLSNNFFERPTVINHNRNRTQQQLNRLRQNIVDDYRNYELEQQFDNSLSNSSESSEDSFEYRQPRESQLQRQFRLRKENLMKKMEQKRNIEKIYKKVMITGQLEKKYKKEEVTCAICLSDFEKAQCSVDLPCKHKFHKKCIDDWLLQKKECPLCKRKYD